MPEERKMATMQDPAEIMEALLNHLNRSKGKTMVRISKGYEEATKEVAIIIEIEDEAYPFLIDEMRIFIDILTSGIEKGILTKSYIKFRDDLLGITEKFASPSSVLH